MTGESRSKTKVQAIGYYGMGNFGDELFRQTVADNAHLLWPSSVVRSFAPTTKTGLYASHNSIGQLLRLASATTSAIWADTFAFCGGSILTDVKGVTAFRSRFFSNKRYEALGVSLGPFADESAESRIKSYLSNFDRVILRDQESQDRFATLFPDALLPQVGGDLAALAKLPCNTSPLSKSNQMTITICPSQAAGVDSGQLTEQVLAALKVAGSLLDTPHINILALNQHPINGDLPLSMALKFELASRGYKVKLKVFDPSSLEVTLQLLASSHMVWSQRLHGAIVAYLCEVPFLLIGHHRKCADFATDIGLNPALLVATDASWSDAARSLLSDTRHYEKMPNDYRNRAYEVYLNSNSQSAKNV